MTKLGDECRAIMRKEVLDGIAKDRRAAMVEKAIKRNLDHMRPIIQLTLEDGVHPSGAVCTNWIATGFGDNALKAYQAWRANARFELEARKW